MNVKRNRTWLLFIACIILSIVFIFFSGVKNVTKSYGIVLLIFSILSIIPAILLTAKIKLPRIFTSGLTFIFYLLWMVSLGLNYYLQSWAGIVFIIILVIFFMLLGMLVALIRTLRSRKNSKYYFTDEEANKTYEYTSFGKAYKKQLSYTLVEGLWDALFSSIFDWF